MLGFLFVLSGVGVVSSLLIFASIWQGRITFLSKQRDIFITYPVSWLVTFLIVYLSLWFDDSPHWIDNGSMETIYPSEFLALSYITTTMVQLVTVPILMVTFHILIFLFKILKTEK